MADAVIIFEREGLDGVIPVGTYLSDAMKRFGIRLDEPCEPLSGLHCCAVTVKSGSALLSPITKYEKEHFRVAGRRENERLACDAKIAGPGELVIMTEEKKKTPSESKEQPKIVEEFETLPLEQKIANLVRMEAVTFGETLSYVINSPFTVLEKVGDVMAEFGMKLEREAKKAARPSEGPADPKQAPKTPAAGKKQGSARSRKSPPAV